MRVAGDGHGDEPWEGPAGASPDDEATRVFSRSEHAPAATAEGDEATRSFSRDPGATRAFTRDAYQTGPEGPAADDPSTAAPAADAGAETSFTRRFVRERHPARGRVPRTDPRPEPPAEPDPGFGPGPDAERERADRRPPRPRRRRPRRKVRKRWIVALLLIAALAVVPGTWGWVWYTARQDDRTPSDAIVVLGASQYNGVPSPVFEARLRQAQELYLDGVAPVIVTVGGKLPDDNFTEAASGRNWLVEVGVPADSVVAVEEGSDTLQSFAAVSEVFDANGWETAILVSDPWHSLRSQVMAEDFGIEAGASPARSGPAVIERRTQLWYITRETASLWYYWIFNDSSDIQVNAA
ncbi:YdcF family protein [Nocardiopsis sp. NRRL B-16309]|uniref:YdcF family protein n=1 Tax=Nocardiopsis sp. NRRL B-16309 TaxID=1519494 RepID=UPI0006AE24ED|nr:YdcF family protein [Nocardiopsis sp. NRRL B-16309]